MKIKIDKGSVVFILYCLWHALILDALAESSANKFVLLASAAGIMATDLYLFFNHYNKNNKDDM